MSCVFCDIINGKIPVKKIYENEHILAFYDSAPQAPVHFLVIAKMHVERVDKLAPNQFDLISKIFEGVVAVAKILNLNDGFRVVNNCGRSAGQTVDHIHFHVLAGREFGWPPG